MGRLVLKRSAPKQGGNWGNGDKWRVACQTIEENKHWGAVFRLKQTNSKTKAKKLAILCKFTHATCIDIDAICIDIVRSAYPVENPSFCSILVHFVRT